MDRDTDLFVQAFWVKCRDVIRPELDLVVDELKGKGQVATRVVVCARQKLVPRSLVL